MKVDMIVEIPAFIVVLVTGALLFSGSELTALLIVKILFGLTAILTNIYCVNIVFQRAKCALNDDWERFESLDQLQHKYGAVVLFGVLGALSTGTYMSIAG